MAPPIIPKTSGIYKITCTANGKIYVGSASNLRRRWRDHRYALHNNKHYNPHLQRAWNRYGADAFLFEVIELVMPWSVKDRENYWLENLKPFDHSIGFNISPKAEAGMSGRKHSIESREKMCAAQTGKKLPDEQKQKIANAMRGKPKTPAAIAKTRAAHLGAKRSPETCERIRIVNTGHKHTPEARGNMSKAQKGKIVSDETRAKISASHMGLKSSPEARMRMSENRCKNTYVVISPEGQEITVRNLNQFCKEHGLTQSKMSAVSLGEQSQHKGWKVMRIKE